MKKNILTSLIFLIAIMSYVSANETGVASFYWRSQKTANGKYFTSDKPWAAHKRLPFGTRILVTNIRNGKSTVVTINDDGPNIKGRILDLSRSSFAKIESTRKGLCKVRIKILYKPNKKTR